MDWIEGGHKNICQNIEVNNTIEILTDRIDELTRLTEDLVNRINKLEAKTIPYEETDYIKESYNELSNGEPEYAPVEKINGYENNGCYGCELMMIGDIKYFHNDHTCKREKI